MGAGQGRSGFEAELLHESSANGVEHDQRLCPLPHGVEHTQEAGVTGFVQRKHLGGESEMGQCSLLLTRFDREAGRGAAGRKELRIQRGEGGLGACSAIESRRRRSRPLLKCTQVGIQRIAHPGFASSRLRLGDQSTEHREVEMALVDAERVGRAASVQESPFRAHIQIGLEDTADRADVLVDDVDGSGWGVAAPHRPDQCPDADRPIVVGQEQRKQQGLLPWAVLDLPIAPPHAQRSENLKLETLGAESPRLLSRDRHITHSALPPVGVPRSGPPPSWRTVTRDFTPFPLPLPSVWPERD